MRLPFSRAVALLAIPLAVLSTQPAPAAQEPPAPRRLSLATDPAIQTRIEALLTTPDVVLTTDFYRIDMRFGPNVSLDAVVVGAVDQRTRLRGLRIGLREEAKPAARTGWSFLDYEEITSLSRALSSIADLADKWSGREDQRSTNLSFTTVEGFAIDIHQAGHLQKVVLSSGFIDPVRASIEILDFAALKQGVDQALALLADK